MRVRVVSRLGALKENTIIYGAGRAERTEVRVMIKVRLIDANAVLRKIWSGNVDPIRLKEYASELIRNAPTIEAEPVRHGRWLPYRIQSGPLAGCTGYRCSRCGREEEDNSEMYCHCGAKMDWGEPDA